MIPVLYEAKETKFRTFGLGEIADAYEVRVTRERNGNYSLYIKYPLDGVFASVFKEELKIKSDAGRRTKWQTFEINRVLRNSKDHIEIFARHISMRTQDIALKPFVSGSSIDAESALEVWRDNLVGDDTFDVKSDILTLGSFNWEVDKIGNARGALGGVAGSILDVYGGEYEFDNRTIILHKQMGRKAPTVLEYGRNIVSVEEERLLDGNYTSIYPYVRYTPQPKPQEEASGKPHIGEQEQPEEQLVTLPEFILDGQYLDLYAQRRIQMVDLSSHFNDDKKEPTVEEIRKLAQKYLKDNNVGAPKISIEVDYIDLSQTLDYQDFRVMEEVELCDIVPLYYPKFGITTETEKVVEIVYDVYTDSNHTIKLGTIDQSISKSLTGGVTQRIETLENNQKVITNNQQQFELNLPKYLNDLNGTKIWYEKPDDNVEHKIGDFWFEKNGKYQRTWVWDGNQWVKIIDTEDLNPNQRAFDEAMAEIEKLKQHQRELDERNQKELEEFRETLKNLSLPEEAIKKITEAIKVDDIPSIKQSFDDLKNKVSETSETARLNAEIIGTDGKTRYNKNLLVGDPNRVKKIDEDFIEVEANDGGFRRGETYTISFSQTCELLKKVAITLTQANNKGVKLVLIPTKAKMEAQTFNLSKDKEVISVYPLSYRAVLTGDWYKSKQIELNAAEVQNLALEMSYRDVVDSNNASLILDWSPNPDVIFDGNGGS
ncbi:phage tail protein [Streptococcus equi subsp. equi]|uniref:phage tail spike protein n=4 Tax=Streptococcus equi TaxID=1336 RepID=UPI000657A5E5|nr:phage tail spike protein [Streptococcus equi]MBT1203219.1 phage tail protein [Streptococcus equi subsp. equi]MBT1207398.1 phage tail protein [Streptococcus equi subsp. equi]MBT1212746.1 phage tail protein [Streptococcus equi subsp. equi]MBT1225986.1 phage tail protein [Streptococcus equi subsp. equi]MBT1228035.1 phage tail protein [Streptococcus equi subsp. equi]